MANDFSIIVLRRPWTVWNRPCSVKHWSNYLLMVGLRSLPGSLLAWGHPALKCTGCMVGLMANSKRVHTKVYLPMQLLLVLLYLWLVPADLHLHRRPPQHWQCSFGSGSFGVTAPFLLVLVGAMFCLCPPRLESLFRPVLWKSYNQIFCPSKSDSLGISSHFVRSLGWEAWGGVLNLQNSGRTSLVLLFSSLWVTHPAGIGFDFIMIVPFLPYPCSFFFVFGCGVSFFW